MPSHRGTSRGEALATVMVNAPHAAYVHTGGVTADPTLLPDYEAAEPEPGVLIMVGDREGWATLHRVEARERSTGKIQFSERIPWPDGSIAARRLPNVVA
jgi:hypothetical protein